VLSTKKEKEPKRKIKNVSVLLSVVPYNPHGLKGLQAGDETIKNLYYGLKNRL
jgi:hypothetical protein